MIISLALGTTLLTAQQSRLFTADTVKGAAVFSEITVNDTKVMKAEARRYALPSGYFLRSACADSTGTWIGLVLEKTTSGASAFVLLPMDKRVPQLYQSNEFKFVSECAWDGEEFLVEVPGSQGLWQHIYSFKYGVTAPHYAGVGVGRDVLNGSRPFATARKLSERVKQAGIRNDSIHAASEFAPAYFLQYGSNSVPLVTEDSNIIVTGGALGSRRGIWVLEGQSDPWLAVPDASPSRLGFWKGYLFVQSVEAKAAPLLSIVDLGSHKVVNSFPAQLVMVSRG